MEALTYTSYGGGVAGLKRAQVPIPDPKKDEIQLRVEAISLNPFDWKIQKGMVRPFLPKKFPHTPCTDVAGEVTKVGSGVSDFKPGDKVVAMLSPATGGGLAEYALAKASATVRRPGQLSTVDGASLATAGITAYQALTRIGGLSIDGSSRVKNILITAASGGVGHVAVQIAKLAPNTHVTVTSGARNVDFLRSLGADEVIDYKTPEGAALKSPSGKKYDLIIDFAAIHSWSTLAANLSAKGRVVYVAPSPSVLLTLLIRKITFSKKTAGLVFAAQKKEDLELLVNWAKDGKLSIKIDSKYPLSKAEDAWAKCIDGHATGKIIVEP